MGVFGRVNLVSGFVELWVEGFKIKRKRNRKKWKSKQFEVVVVKMVKKKFN